jgi:alkylation response protein AidB-like acyl-CoA dehydrogenase
MSDDAAVLESVRRVAVRFANGRRARQLRTHLDADDFKALSEAGFLLTGVPAERGGLWVDVRRSTRPIAEILRVLARSDSSVALVSAMHPAVLSFWLATPQVSEPWTEAWAAQREEVTGAAAAGAWWGTITSEPGTGGDISRTKASAAPEPGGTWRLSGQKHFGSGSGVTSFMITSAVPEGEADPDWFYVDMRDRAWDGSSGARLVARWDGHGMQATESHAFAFERVPATRVARPGHWKALADAAAPFIGTIFTAVVLGILDEAVECARRDLASRKEVLRPYERVEWTRAETEAWVAVQAYEGMLRAVEHLPMPAGAVLRGKTAVAELAESVLRRICRVLGGATYARHNPYGFWFEDVRALGFLRPPWGLAFDVLYETGWPDQRA